MLQALQHPNIVTFYGVSVHSTDMYIVMRLMSGGTVWNKLHRPAFPMDARLKMNWALQTARWLLLRSSSPFQSRYG